MCDYLSCHTCAAPRAKARGRARARARLAQNELVQEVLHDAPG